MRKRNDVSRTSAPGERGERRGTKKREFEITSGNVPKRLSVTTVPERIALPVPE